MTAFPSTILALDQGTTSSRALVFGGDGELLATAQQEYPQHFPQDGWVEHNPQDIWQSQIEAAREALNRARVSARDVAAIGIANQRETTLLWDRKTGKPLSNALVWQDRRTAHTCERLKNEGREPWFRERTGLPLDPYFSGTKLAYLLDNVPSARARAERGELAFGTVDTWLLWNLTGGRVHATDPTNASRTLLYDLHTGDWSPELCAALNVPLSVLPQIVPSSGIVTQTDADILGASVPIAGITGDQQAALFGQNCVRPGNAKNTYGTGCFLLQHTGNALVSSHHGLLSTVAATLTGEARAFALEGSVFTGGAVVQWLRDGLGLIQTSGDVETLAASVPDSGGVTLVPAFTGLGAPYWNPHARGAMLGITRATTGAHIARAALEAIAFQSAEVVWAMEKDAKQPLTELRVDGGASANNLLMQMQADILGVPVARPDHLESTAWGAARLAGIAVGLYPADVALPSPENETRVFAPQISRDEAQARLARWQNAIQRVNAP